MPNAVTPDRYAVNRQYKSSIFAMLFGGEKELLELYNAINGTSYTDPSLLRVNTLENDVSFLIDVRLHLYEHQSTWNPNMPLRNLFYVSDLYSEMTAKKNLYGSAKVNIPAPRFFVFYNGGARCPDRVVLKLSDLYWKEEAQPSLDLEVTVLNINKGHNETLMKSCRALREYAEYTARVRKNAASLPLHEAVESAVTSCIRDGILEDFLLKNRAEVMKVSIYEYNAEEHLRMEREAALEEGREKGRQMGLAEGRKEGREEGREELLLRLIKNWTEDGKTPSQIAGDLRESEETVRKLIDKVSCRQT